MFLKDPGFIAANPFLSFRSTPMKLFLADPLGAAPVKLFLGDPVDAAPVKLFSSSSGFMPGKLLFDSESDARFERVEPESEGRWEPASEGRSEPETEGRRETGREEKGVEATEDSVEGLREVPREEVGVFLPLTDLRDLGFFSKRRELVHVSFMFLEDVGAVMWWVEGSTYNMVASVSGVCAEWLFVCMVTVFVVGITESE